MSEPTMTYTPDRAARFLNQGPPAERLHRLQRQMRLIADQYRILVGAVGGLRDVGGASSAWILAGEALDRIGELLEEKP